MKIVTIIGARPQFIKAATVSRAIFQHNNATNSGNSITEVIVHTGQHYDHNMSKIFFEELEIPEPDYNLDVGSNTHGRQTGRMLSSIEEVLEKERPDLVLVYGDTNSTLAGALAASKLNVPVAHVEAGLRSYNRKMPEEINRVVTDHISSFLFCPTKRAIENLSSEGIENGVKLVGDVMFDAFLFYKQNTSRIDNIVEQLKIKKKGYCLATIHRAENTDNLEKLSDIFDAFTELGTEEQPIVVPLHPRTRERLKNILGFDGAGNRVRIIQPVGYLQMIVLEVNAFAILTDSGGVQKEAYFSKVPCITLRNETEWVETVEAGWNHLAGTEKGKIISSFKRINNSIKDSSHSLYGDGDASKKIITELLRYFS